MVKYMLHIRRPSAARGYSRRALQQRPAQRVPGRLDMGNINLTTTNNAEEHCPFERSFTPS